MDSVYLYDRWYGHIPSAGWDEVTSQTEWVCYHWDQPDEGIWAFEKMLTHANHAGLYAEQISRAGQQQGNFPQALTHPALISASFNLGRALGP
jgi:GH15 family glucan-1,4-alpha-glucosidase